MFLDHAGRPYWLDPRTGHRVYCVMPTPQGCINLLLPSPAMGAAVPNHGCFPCTMSSDFYGCAPQPFPVAPQLMPVAPLPTPIMIPAPALKKEKKECSSKKKQWEKFYDKQGRPTWIHSDTGKRTREYPYV